MGGKETLEILRSMQPGLKAIVSSGYAKKDPIMAKYKDYGFAGVFPKPYRIEELCSVLHATLH